jgi:hypothetical protein
MTTPGRYHFVAWSRRGIGSELANPDYGGALPVRGTLSAALTVAAQGPSPASEAAPPVTVLTYGPGDVLGLDARHVIRTDPKDGTANYEPNYLACIEFDLPDLLWLFTPAAPAGDRLRPWLALVVLKDGEYTPVTPPPQPLPAIDVSALGALQLLDDAWNWAHTQVSGDAGLAATLSGTPGAVISRLMCPRRLDPETGYTAFLVPAFEAGRLAGLGQDVSGLTSTAAAWTTATQGPLRLPYLYTFRFHTSDQGDFESLVRRLVPRKLGTGIGQRLMSVDDPMADFPSAGPPLGLDGALMSLVTAETPWNDPAKTTFQDALATFINVPAPVTDDPAHPNPDDPVVVPPIYGRWHAGVSTVSPGATGWLDGLNLDPRPRTEAGTGTQVIQAHLTALMASAWQQVAGIELANSLLRGAQLARGTLTLLHARRLAVASNATLLTLTAPLHARLLASPQTVRAVIAGSRVPGQMFAPAFRRTTSPAGAIRRRQAAAGAVIGSLGALVDRVNAAEIAIVPPPAPPGGLVAIEDISDATRPPWSKYLPIRLVAHTPEGTLRAVIEADGPSGGIRIAGLTPRALAAVPPRPGFAITEPPANGTGTGGTGTGTGGTGGTSTGGPNADSVEASRFRQAMIVLGGALQAPAADPPLAAALDTQALRDTVVARIDPAVTVPARVLSLVDIGARLGWQPADPIQPIMAAPTFPQPMYAPLRDLSPDYILPGVEQIPPDTVGLLQSNHAFIEAYMVGLNHEMARQLLWTGYPTDLRGSYFRQFWDVSGYVPQATDPTDPTQLAELLKDIPLINTWPLAGPLGSHENRTGIVPDNVVLLIRGELLRRYPNTVIYAAKAKLDGRQRVIDPTDERYPLFAGTLPTDITFIGFNLSEADAKGGTPASPEGFFFVFQQHPTEPRFGLEPSATGTVQHWADLAWTNFAVPQQQVIAQAARQPAATPAIVTYSNGWAPWRLASSVFGTVLAQTSLPAFLSAGATPQDTAITDDADDPGDTANTWGADAAQTAYITLRMPFRIAIHADLMVPQ